MWANEENVEIEMGRVNVKETYGNRESLKERDKTRKGARDRKGGRIRGRDRKYSQTTR